MTIDRIMGFVLGTILMGIGFKIGEYAIKKAENAIGKAWKEWADDEKTYKDNFMSPMIV